MGKTILNLQAMRAVAALTVVCAHLNYFLDLAGIPFFGHGGVDIFFVISGYLMVRTTQTRPPTPAQFFLNRIVRIVPLYWLVTLAVFGVATVSPHLLQSTHADVLDLIRSLFFIPFEKENGRVHPLLFVGWTLNYEMFFYLIFAIGLAFRRYVVGVAVTCGALVALMIVGAILHPRNVGGIFYTDTIMLEFVFGMLLAAGTRYAPKNGSSLLKAFAFAAALLSFVVVAAWTEGDGVRPRGLFAGSFAAATIAAAVLLDLWGWRITSPTWLRLGDASYAIYLTHPFVTQAIQKAARDLALTQVQAILGLFLSLVCVSFVGWIVHRWIETPLTLAARRLTSRGGVHTLHDGGNARDPQGDRTPTR